MAIFSKFNIQVEHCKGCKEFGERSGAGLSLRLPNVFSFFALAGSLFEQAKDAVVVVTREIIASLSCIFFFLESDTVF